MAVNIHTKQLRQGIDTWNKWRIEHPNIRPDLSETDFSWANLRETNLSRANLSGANLSGADLIEANLSEADLSRVNLSGADLSKANLSEANLSWANLSGADLREANLSNAILKRANLDKAKIDNSTKISGKWRLVWEIINQGAQNQNLSKADLSGADLSSANLSKANLSETDLRETCLRNTILDNATLTGTQLWNTDRKRWSIKDVICNYVYWDRESKKKVHYAPHEFEKLYSKKAKITLYYKDALNFFEIQTLPILIKNLKKEYKNWNFNIDIDIDSFRQDINGTNINITVEGANEHEVQIIEKVLRSKYYCSICRKSENEVERFINMLGISICENCLINILDNEGVTTRIQRSLVFKPEHKQAGISILNYFSEIIKQKYPHIKVKVKIEQEQSTVRMIVETPEGEIKKVEETLDQYGMVVQGKMLPEQLLSDPFEIMALKQKLELSALELRHTKELLNTARNYDKNNKEKIFQLENQVKSLYNLVGECLRGTKSAHLLTKKLLDKYNSNDIVKDSLELIGKKINIGIKPSDEKEIKQTLESIRKEDPKVLKELSSLLKGSIAGVGGNLLYSWIITVTNVLPK